MCTISWLYQGSDYHVFFNRDEDKRRPAALAPALFSEGRLSCVMPVDPQGNGTWLATNSAGITLALLNFYQGRTPKGRLRSRGLVVRQLALATGFEAVERELIKMPLEKTAPFSLLVFEPGTGEAGVPLLRWTGKQLEQGMQQSPLISSALRYREVVAARARDYHHFILAREALSAEDFYKLHRSHWDGASATSVCMHRDDAETVSFSHIEVRAGETLFHYADGSPCRTPVKTIVQMHRDNRGYSSQMAPLARPS